MKILRHLVPPFLVLALTVPALWAAEDKPDPGPAPGAEETAAATELAKHGALVQPLAAQINWRYVNLRGVAKGDGAIFPLLGKIPSIVDLDASGTTFKPEEFVGIANLKNLTKLNLANSSVTDAGLAQLKGLEKLVSLNLFHTEVTDAGLANLQGLKGLQRLYVFETKVTDAGAAALVKALPAVKIDQGWAKSAAATAAAAAAAKPPEVKPATPPTPPAPPKPEEKKPEPPKPPVPPTKPPEAKPPVPPVPPVTETKPAPPAVPPTPPKPEEKKPEPPKSEPAKTPALGFDLIDAQMAEMRKALAQKKVKIEARRSALQKLAQGSAEYQAAQRALSDLEMEATVAFAQLEATKNIVESFRDQSPAKIAETLAEFRKELESRQEELSKLDSKDPAYEPNRKLVELLKARYAAALADFEETKKSSESKSKVLAAEKQQPTAAALTPAKPEEVGLDGGKLAGIHPAMEALIAQQRGAGVVTLVLRDGRLAYLDAAGLANRESGRVMTTDALFWVASMTKNITATAVMILVDEGKLSLDEPAQKWVPELAKAKLANGQAPARAVTLRDFLSHTSGLADPARKPTDGNFTLEEYTRALVNEPFEFQPGSKFEYSFGPTVAGRCVEVASGMPFQKFIRERILKPLQMSDTTFSPDAVQRLRLARSYKLSGAALVPAHCAFLTSEPDVQREAEPSGGLFSTALDMARFYEMIREGGKLDSVRILSEKAVGEMTKSMVIDGKPIPYGVGWFTNGAQNKVTPAFGVGSFGHPGAFGTHGWVDPEKKMVVVFMVQNAIVPKGGELCNKFCELAAAAVK